MIRGICYFLISFILFSCSRRERDSSTLVFWSSNNPQEIDFTRTYIDKWNQSHPDRRISFQPVPEGQSSEEVILAAIVGKTTPDMYANMWQGDVEDFAQSGVLIALDTLDGFLEFLYARCDSAVVKEITSRDGHIYQVPWKVNPILMMYNPVMLSDAGINHAPSTYDEFLSAGAALKQRSLMLGISETNAIWWQRFFNFLPLYYAASGGKPLIENDKAIFNNEHGLAVFSFLQKVYNQEYFPREQLKGQSDPFLAGRLATTFTGPWTIEYHEKFKPEGFQYEFAKVPTPQSPDSIVYTYGDPKNIVIFNTCRDPQTAWDFLSTMLSPEADLQFLEISGQFPRRKDINSNRLFTEYLQQHPRLMPFASQAVHVKGIDSHPHMKEVLDLLSQEYEACVVYGIKDPKEAINDAAAAVDLLYLNSTK